MVIKTKTSKKKAKTDTRSEEKVSLIPTKKRQIKEQDFNAEEIEKKALEFFRETGQKKKEYIKHLVSCKCILPQFKNSSPVIYHRFIAFSELDEYGLIIPSYAQCTNCGSIHKIIEVGKSSIINKEEMKSLPTIEDIKLNIPERLANVLIQSDVPLSTWQEVQFILENKLWGRMVVLAKEREEDSMFIKYMIILGENLFKVDTYERDNLNEIVQE